jgi:hypothetical protein
MPSDDAGCLAGSEYDALLRGDFAAFAQRAFHEFSGGSETRDHRSGFVR